MLNPAHTDEARAKRQARRARRGNGRQHVDVLAERQRLITFWRLCATTNRAYAPHNGAWWFVFTWNPCFRHLLMPALRARIEARERARRDKYNAELRAYAQQWAAKKAERAAAKARAKAPQRDLIDEAGAC